jgi:UDP-GlcNAc3NAcA epimerase
MPELQIVTVLGARPQFVKGAALSRSFERSGNIREMIVNTGQHYDDGMSSVFFRQFQLPTPCVDLAVGSGPHGAQTGRMMEGIERVLLRVKPDWVVVVGDTNSTLAGALAAAKCQIPVAHVESGVRSFNRLMPEEINRVVTDRISDLLLAPSEVAVKNLLHEAAKAESIVNVGDIMLDVFEAHRAEAARLRADVLQTCGVRSKEYVLATIHRAENTDDSDRLRTIFSALAELSRDLPVVLPAHPRTRTALDSLGIAATFGDAFKVIAPLGYLEMLALEIESKLVVTDSGGVQKEAFYAGTPCVVVRGETEWPELVGLGWSRLAFPGSPAAVYDACRDWLIDRQRDRGGPYGDGRAGMKIAAALLAAETSKGRSNECGQS